MNRPGRNRRTPSIVRRGSPHRFSWRNWSFAPFRKRLHAQHSIGAEFSRDRGLRAGSSCPHRVRTGGLHIACARARQSSCIQASASAGLRTLANHHSRPAELANAPAPGGNAPGARDCAGDTYTDRSAHFCNTAHVAQPAAEQPTSQNRAGAQSDHDAYTRSRTVPRGQRAACPSPAAGARAQSWRSKGHQAAPKSPDG